MTTSDVRSAVELIVGHVGDSPGDAVVFVDFDGTLAPIVDVPDDAMPVPGALAALDRIAAQVSAVIVLSGRPVAFLAGRLEAASRHPAVRVFGLYGQEELLAGGATARVSSAAPFRAAFEESAAMARLAAPGARIEDKGDSIAFHFREAPENEEALREVAKHAAGRFGLEIRNGRMVVELVAPAAPDKGSIVRRFLIDSGAGIAFGDDIGDIAAFTALDAARTSDGATVVKVAVGGREAPAALVALADVVLASPSEVAAVIDRVAAALEQRRAATDH